MNDWIGTPNSRPRGENLGSGGDGPVAGIMAEPVLDRLEVVQIGVDEKDRRRPAAGCSSTSGR